MEYKIVSGQGSVTIQKLYDTMKENVATINHCSTGDVEKVYDRMQKIVDLCNKYYLEHGHAVNLVFYGKTDKPFNDNMCRLTIDNDNEVNVEKLTLCGCGIHVKEECDCMFVCDICDGCTRSNTCSCDYEE